jgi:CMP-N-acetylneuraminic acid synthetase
MYKEKRILGVIPARAGSKGLPGKNIKVLNGKPLIAWTIMAGEASAYLDELMVSTEDERIAEVAAQNGVIMHFKRPLELADDKTPSIDVVQHVVDEYAARGKSFDYIALLEPTSPLRERGDIDRMIKALIDKPQYDAIVSVGPVREHPGVVKRVVGEVMSAFVNGLAASTRRQDDEPAYYPYGGVYIIKTSVLAGERTFYPSKSLAHIVRKYQCYEIDDIYDFIAVENVMKHQWGVACAF